MRIISGRLGGRRLAEPPASRTRPTTDLVRGAVFNVLAPRIEDSRFLDLFAGTGAVGLEALSRGAASVDWVEWDRQAFTALLKNVRALAPDQERAAHRVKAKDFLAAATAAGTTFDIIFADPPYGDDVADLAPSIAQCLAPGGYFMLEYRSGSPVLSPPGLSPAFSRSYGETCLSGYTRPAVDSAPE